ncbi:helix-turn-helix domain containing protein [Mammaliicoccus sciuri]|uniref:helix-turn-helix domain-containing protein n=1 Tax=Mammaliicoccus sciuri TaxID=1296 RepID=UPI002DB80681|nr:helix-turn-helix domain-containing protein [Mammaliicoccus sciuri]MEB6226356.1 helix-turn-helix domain containing protein [Mammaliicoccus sciuri]
MARVNAKDWITEEGLTKIEGWARDGLTNDQIAHNIGCNRATLYSWIKRYSDIDNALKRAKEVVDREVESQLHKRAMGYYVEEVTYEYGEEVKRVRKHIAPDVTAQIFWLKNRKPTEWRDKRDVEHSGEMTTNVNNMNNLSEEELRKLAKLDGD